MIYSTIVLSIEEHATWIDGNHFYFKVWIFFIHLGIVRVNDESMYIPFSGTLVNVPCILFTRY